MSDVDEHLDIEELKKAGRKGWFVKRADDMPAHKKYRTSCKQGGRGFLGPNFGAHHIIPQESIDESTREFKDPQQIEDVKHITDYILNNPNNMLGLPSFWSFNAWYEAQRRKSGLKGDVSTEYPGFSARWMNSYQDETMARWREKFLSGLAKTSPENHPIHAPVSWGHTEYSKQVTAKLKQQVWVIVKRQKSKHKITRKALQTIEAQLRAIESTFHTQLTTRGATSPERWERRKNQTDADWYGPYTMTNTTKNPIWG